MRKLKLKFSLLLLWGVVLGFMCVNVCAEVPFEYKTGKAVFSVHAADGFIAAGSDDKNVYLFDSKGNLKWKKPTDGFVRSVYIADGYVAAGSFIVASEDLEVAENDPGTIIKIVSTKDSRVYLFDTAGNLKWTYKTHGGVTSVHISGGYVAAATLSCNGYVYLFDMDGNLKWKFSNYPENELMEKDCRGFESVSISKNNVAAGLDVAGSKYRSGMIYFFDLNTGKLIRDYEAYGTVWDAYSTEDYTAAGSQDGYVYLFDKDGYPEWSKKTGAGVNSVKIYKNYVAAGSDDGYAYLFDISGKKLWEHKEGTYLNEHVNSIDVSDEGIIVGTLLFTYLLDFNGNLKWKWSSDFTRDVSFGENYIAAGTGNGFVDIFEFGREYKKPLPVLNLIILGFGFIAIISLAGVAYYYSKKGLKKKKKREFN